MAHGYPSKSKMRSYCIKPFMMNKATFNARTKGHFQQLVYSLPVVAMATVLHVRELWLHDRQLWRVLPVVADG